MFSMAMTACAAKFVQQFDLLFGEGPNFLADQGKRADHLVLLQHRHAQGGPRTTKFDGSNVHWIEAFGVGLYRRAIGDLSNCLGRC